MPWCPQCGAEYREGFVTCAKCGVALVAERPASASRSWQESLPSVLRRPAADVLRGLDYALTALRLLYRHPIFLVIPLAIAVFNVADREVSRSGYARIETTGGKEYVSVSPDLWFRLQLLPPVLASSLSSPAVSISLLSVQHAFTEPLLEALPRTPSVPFPRGLIALIMALTTGSTVLALLLSALLLAGYYGTAGLAAMGEAPTWTTFGRSLKQQWLRFWHFLLLVWAVGAWASYLAVLEAAPSRFATIWIYWVYPVIAFFLALGPFVIIVDNARVIEAARRSILTVARGLPVALTLLAITIVLKLAVLWPLQSWAFRVVLNEYLGALHGPASSHELLRSVPWGLAAYGWPAIVGAWLCLAMFLWYRDARRPAAPELTGDRVTDRRL